MVTPKEKMYCVPATTVVFGVRVRVPALFHAAVELKTGAAPVWMTGSGCVEVVVPARPLRTTVVPWTPLSVKQVVYKGTALVNVTVNVFDEQGLDVSCPTVALSPLDRILSGKASPACTGTDAEAEESKATAGAKLALVAEI